MSCRMWVAVAVLALTPSLAARENAAAVPSDTVAALFETASNVIVTPTGMMITAPQVRTIMLVKRADDGTLVTACVTSAAAAEEFLRPTKPDAGVRTRTEK